MTGVCEICKKWKPLDRHHVFNSYNRKNSEKYGAIIYVCSDCHAKIHADAKLRNRLKETNQKKLMNELGWTEEEFREIFGKSYIRRSENDSNN